MKAHGILMQDEMVRALLRPVGDPPRKTVTRRTADQWARRAVGDLLWVRECHCSADMGPVREGGPIAYRSDYTAERIKRDRLRRWANDRSEVDATEGHEAIQDMYVRADRVLVAAGWAAEVIGGFRVVLLDLVDGQLRERAP